MKQSKIVLSRSNSQTASRHSRVQPIVEMMEPKEPGANVFLPSSIYSVNRETVQMPANLLLVPILELKGI